MKLIHFCKFLENNISNNEVQLNGSSLVIDGHNFLYRMYKRSNLRSLFGCESNFYAKYVRDQLEIFRKADVKCYFVFKGGNEAENEKKFKLPMDENEVEDKNICYQPLFAREVYKEVLNDMGFDYAICEYTNKKECVALAQRLDCAILSCDVEFFFYGVKYIPYTNLNYDPSTNTLKGKLFKLDVLKDKFQVDDGQIALFSVLFDENIFSNEFINNLFRKLRLPTDFRCRREYFLNWLSRNGQLALKMISQVVTDDEYRVLRLELERTINTFNNKIFQPDGLVTKYFLNKNTCAINRCDQEWFAKGILWKFVAIPYINVYRYGILKGSWSIEDLEAEDSMLLSAPIVRYALDLLTNFNNNDLIFIGRANQIHSDECILLNDDGTVRIRSIIRKPDYGPSNVFENGWGDVGNFQLLEHFLRESIHVEVAALQNAPTECRLLIAALVYFARRKRVDVDNEVYAVLLSYVVLGVIDEVAGRDGTLDDKQCKIARDSMYEYFNITSEEATRILDRKLLHPLVEFQHCLRQFNFLNTLCGSYFTSAVFSKTYNATFVYKVLYTIRQNYKGDGSKFLKDKLKQVPTVLSFVKKLFNIYIEVKDGEIKSHLRT